MTKTDMNEKPEPLSQDELRDMFPLSEEYDWFQNMGIKHMAVYGIRRLKIHSVASHTRLWFGWIRSVDGQGYDDDGPHGTELGWAVAFADRGHTEIFSTAQEAYQHIYNRFLFDRPEGY